MVTFMLRGLAAALVVLSTTIASPPMPPRHCP